MEYGKSFPYLHNICTFRKNLSLFAFSMSKWNTVRRNYHFEQGSPKVLPMFVTVFSDICVTRSDKHSKTLVTIILKSIPLRQTATVIPVFITGHPVITKWGDYITFNIPTTVV